MNVMVGGNEYLFREVLEGLQSHGLDDHGDLLTCHQQVISLHKVISLWRVFSTHGVISVHGVISLHSHLCLQGHLSSYLHTLCSVCVCVCVSVCLSVSQLSTFSKEKPLPVILSSIYRLGHPFSLRPKPGGCQSCRVDSVLVVSRCHLCPSPGGWVSVRIISVHVTGKRVWLSG